MWLKAHMDDHLNFHVVAWSRFGGKFCLLWASVNELELLCSWGIIIEEWHCLLFFFHICRGVKACTSLMLHLVQMEKRFSLVNNGTLFTWNLPRLGCCRYKIKILLLCHLGYDGLTNVGTEIVSDWTCLYFFVIYLLIYW